MNTTTAAAGLTAGMRFDQRGVTYTVVEVVETHLPSCVTVVCDKPYGGRTSIGFYKNSLVKTRA